MLGYTVKDLSDMSYGIESADLLINADEHPAIHNYLVKANEFLIGLYTEGHFD